MKSSYLLLSILIFALVACSGGTSISNDPHEVTLKWIEWHDNENFEELMKISKGNTLTYVKDMEVFFEGVDQTSEPNEPTIVENMVCEDEGEKKKCTYCCKDGEEEIFVLSKENGQWKVEDIIVAIREIDEESQNQERILEKMLNKELPNESK